MCLNHVVTIGKHLWLPTLQLDILACLLWRYIWVQMLYCGDTVAATGGGGAAGRGADGGGLTGHPSDAIFDKFPICKTTPPIGQWIAYDDQFALIYIT